MQVPLPRAKGNRDIDDICVARPAAQQADSAGDRVVQGDDHRALVAEQRGDPRLWRSAAPRLSNGTRGHRDLQAVALQFFGGAVTDPGPGRAYGAAPAMQARCLRNVKRVVTLSGGAADLAGVVPVVVS